MIRCPFEWNVDTNGAPVTLDTCGRVVRCIREHTVPTFDRHIARHPTAVGEFVFHDGELQGPPPTPAEGLDLWAGE